MDSIFKRDGEFYTNADAVAEWIEYKASPTPSRRLILPDCKQVYLFTGEETTSKGTALLCFTSQCRICGADFVVRRSLAQMKKSPAMVRNCREHLGEGRSERGAWMRGFELAALEDQEVTPKAYTGRAQDDVLLALDELEELFTPVPVDLLLKQAAKKAWRGRSKRDERVKTARTALRALVRRGLVDPARLVTSTAASDR